ncbi:MAG: carboxynorspermidine decarboxylase [Helicobacteraceae bacterium]|nr:carboxynorspermidine decarboxylase [Helicobacteraceae bacterium]
MKFPSDLPSPAYVIEEAKLIKNLEILRGVEEKSGAKILCALKSYALWETFPLIAQYISGAAASGLYEARLAREEMNKEVSTFCPAITAENIGEIAELSDHLIFNSFSQLASFRDRAITANPRLEIAVRVNPLYSEVTPAIYNPCVAGSRLGVPPEEFKEEFLPQLDGLHFHTHCEQNSDALERAIPHFEKHFGRFLRGKKWINMGGGHHITREDYDIAKLIDIVKKFSDKHGVQVYLEPGEAIAWQTGYLRSRVVDIVRNEMTIAILDASAAAHMPDCLEMPYRPDVQNAAEWDKKAHNYRLGGPTCLAGDVVGDYSFSAPLAIGDDVIFEDMIHYTMVKNNMFNGAPLPAIVKYTKNGEYKVIREFNFNDYRNRLS